MKIGCTWVNTVEGFVTSQFLSFMPVILTLYVVMAAAGTVTVEIESGTMDYLLAHPVPRWRVALEKYLALLVAVLLICLLIGLGLWMGGSHYRAEHFFRHVDAGGFRYRSANAALCHHCFRACVRAAGARYPYWGNCGAGCGGLYLERPGPAR